MKRLLVLLLGLVLSGAAVSFAAAPPVGSFDATVQQEATAQTKALQDTGKYKHIGLSAGKGYWVDEYVTPKGEPGYQMRWEDAVGWHSRGYGPEATDRTYDKPRPALIASTTLSFLQLFTPLAYGFTSNTQSTTLVAASSQWWSITSGAQTGLNFSTAFTLSSRIKLTTNATGGIVVRGDGATSESYRFIYISTHVLRVQLNLAACTADVSWTPSTGVWYNPTVSYNAGTIKFFVDAVQQGTDQPCDASISSTNDPFNIGSNAGAAIFFNGKIDDTRAWSRVLTPTEISDLYNNPCTFNNGASFSGEWLFEGNGNDSSGNNNNLTNNNSATFSSDVPYTCPAVATPSLGTMTFFGEW